MCEGSSAQHCTLGLKLKLHIVKVCIKCLVSKKVLEWKGGRKGGEGREEEKEERREENEREEEKKEN